MARFLIGPNLSLYNNIGMQLVTCSFPGTSVYFLRAEGINITAR
jgi:hypothetical protein